MRRLPQVVALLSLLFVLGVSAREYTITQIADETRINREPSVSETGLVAWFGTSSNDNSEIVCYRDGKRTVIATEGEANMLGSVRPQMSGNSIAWVAAFHNTLTSDLREVLVEAPDTMRVVDVPPEQFTNRTARAEGSNDTAQATNGIKRSSSGNDEIILWHNSSAQRITRDQRQDLGPSLWNDQIVWQKARGWPFGWEIMFWAGGEFRQLTTNFNYDVGAKIQGSNVVWSSWDGHDFEIFMYDTGTKIITQITSNEYDDLSPVVWDGTVAWEGYRAAEADIYAYNKSWSNAIKKISDNPYDDINPRIWNGQIVWQGFDGDDYEIYLYSEGKTVKITDNRNDDVNPDIRDGVITWMGYKDNWDAEIFVRETDGQIKQLTDNDEEDRDPRTAGGRVVWQQQAGNGKYRIFLAEPK